VAPCGGTTPSLVEYRQLIDAYCVGDHPAERVDQCRRLAALGVDADRAAQRDDLAHAFAGLVRAIECKHAPQAPAHQADLAAGLVVQVADFLLQRLGMAALKTDVAAQPPGLNFVAQPRRKVLSATSVISSSMKPGSNNTGWPSPCGAVPSKGQVKGSIAISTNARHSSNECRRAGLPW